MYFIYRFFFEREMKSMPSFLDIAANIFDFRYRPIINIAIMDYRFDIAFHINFSGAFLHLFDFFFADLYGEFFDSW